MLRQVVYKPVAATAAFTAGLCMPFIPAAIAAGFAEDLPEKILSQCGIATALLVAGLIWMAMQNAKTRSAWETDRGELIKIILSQNTTNNTLNMAKEKLEGMLLAVESRRR